MNNTAIIILSAIFITLGSIFLSMFYCPASAAGGGNTQFSVMDGAFKTAAVAPFTFAKAGTRPTIAKETRAEFSKIANHLKSNENRSLNLVGNYYSSEKPKGDTNLGLARAEAIKAELEKLGAPEGSITTSSQKLSSVQTGDLIYEPVSFEFMEKKTSEVIDAAPALTEPKGEVSVLDPYTLRFQTGVSKLTMTPELRSYLDRALAYLKENPGTTLMVTGHTDDEGGAAGNMKLSKDRAAKVRRFLRNNGVGSKQVNYQGKGETSPIAPNTSEDGKRLNRRVEIVIQ